MTSVQEAEPPKTPDCDYDDDDDQTIQKLEEQLSAQQTKLREAREKRAQRQKQLRQTQFERLQHRLSELDGVISSERDVSQELRADAQNLRARVSTLRDEEHGVRADIDRLERSRRNERVSSRRVELEQLRARRFSQDNVLLRASAQLR
eukprot:1004656_1